MDDKVNSTFYHIEELKKALQEKIDGKSSADLKIYDKQGNEVSKEEMLELIKELEKFTDGKDPNSTIVVEEVSTIVQNTPSSNEENNNKQSSDEFKSSFNTEHARSHETQGGPLKESSRAWTFGENGSQFSKYSQSTEPNNEQNFSSGQQDTYQNQKSSYYNQQGTYQGQSGPYQGQSGPYQGQSGPYQGQSGPYQGQSGTYQGQYGQQGAYQGQYQNFQQNANYQYQHIYPNDKARYSYQQRQFARSYGCLRAFLKLFSLENITLRTRAIRSEFIKPFLFIFFLYVLGGFARLVFSNFVDFIDFSNAPGPLYNAFFFVFALNAVHILLMFFLSCVWARRFKDLNWWPCLGFIPFGLILLEYFGSLTLYYIDQEILWSIYRILPLSSTTMIENLVIFVLIIPCLCKGTIGPNKYGEDPIELQLDVVIGKQNSRFNQQP